MVEPVGEFTLKGIHRLLLAVCCYGLCDYGVSPYMAFS